MAPPACSRGTATPQRPHRAGCDAGRPPSSPRGTIVAYGLPDLSTFTGFLIRRAQQAHVAVWQREVSAEVTSVQFGVLNLLHRFPGASQRDLCDGLDLDRSTIADIVSRLETSGLIERVRDARDRRRNILHRSERGESELLALMPRAHRVDHVLTDTLSPSDRAELQRLLTARLDAPDVREVIRDAPLPGL